MDLSSTPHRRFDPLRREWVVVSPHRSNRPWQGQLEPVDPTAVPQHDPQCYLCPGNTRANGETNPQYASTFAFDNDFPGLRPTSNEPRATSNEPRATSNEPRATSNEPRATSNEQRAASNGLFVASAERGLCRVLCFSPRHDLTLSQMDAGSIRSVVDAWVGEYAAMAKIPWVDYVTIFENRGAIMGASNPHPHGQIWATEHVPNEPAVERVSLAAYRAEHGTCLLCDYAEAERERGERIVCRNDRFIAVVPFWAVWPFETLVVSREHVAAMVDLDEPGRDALADVLKQLTARYDRLFGVPFPYSMGFHQELRAEPASNSHLHAHFYPPLLRSATIRKFMVGFELLGSPQRDLTPEEAARRLAGASQ